MTKTFLFSFLVLIFLSCNPLTTRTEINKTSNTTNKTPETENITGDCETLNFHYLIASDSMATPKLRYIEVFLDERAFSEENLVILFTYLSSKYSEPNFLTINVKTNWAQFSLPSECSREAISEEPDKPDKYNYHHAVFSRRGEREFFRYNPILKTSDFRTVIIRN